MPGKARNHPVNQQLVADRLGLSRQVVSAILGRRPGNVRYSQRTEQAVLAMAEELGYRLPPRNALAGIHVVVSRSIYNISDGLLDELLVACRADGLPVAIDVLPTDERNRLPTVRGSGWVNLAFPSQTDAWLPLLADTDRPVLTVNLPAAPGARLDYDEGDGMGQLLRWLRRADRRMPAYLHPGRSIYTEARITGYHQACRETGIGEGLRHEYTIPDMTNSMAGFLHLHPEIDAVIIEHPIMMGPLLDALRLCGRQVPGQVQPCTFIYSNYLYAVCPHAMCLDIRAPELARFLIERCRALAAGEAPGIASWPYRLRSVAD